MSFESLNPDLIRDQAQGLTHQLETLIRRKKIQNTDDETILKMGCDFLCKQGDMKIAQEVEKKIVEIYLAYPEFQTDMYQLWVSLKIYILYAYLQSLTETQQKSVQWIIGRTYRWYGRYKTESQDNILWQSFPDYSQEIQEEIDSHAHDIDVPVRKKISEILHSQPSL